MVNLIVDGFHWLDGKGEKLEYRQMHRANDGHGLYSEEEDALDVDEDASISEVAITLPDEVSIEIIPQKVAAPRIK